MPIKTRLDEPLVIHSGQGDYQVEFVQTTSMVAERLLESSQALALVDQKLAQLYPGIFEALKAKFPALLIEATEEEKTLSGVERVLKFFQSVNATKQTNVIVVGGGIIQDIAALASHIYYRGLRWVFAPTTLLAMSDSCIGAKCGVNFGAFKNQLGAFHSPSRVIICPAFLDTLSDDDVRSGYGEIFKLSLTGLPENFSALKNSLNADGFRSDKLSEWIYLSLQTKKGIIEEDEYEHGLRYLLNYGHTFGHALESLTAHAIPHGLAVAWGCDLVNYLSVKKGMLASDDFDNIHKLVEQHFHFPLKAPITAKALIEAAQRDKKVLAGRLNLILLSKPGKLQRVPIEFDAELERWVGEYLGLSNVLRNRD